MCVPHAFRLRICHKTSFLNSIGPLLGLTPSFMRSGVVPALYASIQGLVELLPVVPAPSFALEFPLSLLDGFSRAYLLCNLIPPAVTAHTSPIVATSPWTLLITSLVRINVLPHSLFPMRIGPPSMSWLTLLHNQTMLTSMNS